MEAWQERPRGVCDRVRLHGSELPIRKSWRREPDYRISDNQRSGNPLITLSILIALGGVESQVKGHIRGDLNVGHGRDVLVDVITQLLPWVGYPRTLNALSALNEVAPE